MLSLLVAVVVSLGLPVPAWADEGGAAPVYFVGIPNLLWTDLDERETPAMWGLLGESAAASLAVRSYGAKSCPDDAWASIGAGNRARSNYGSGLACPLGSLIGPPLTTSDGAWQLAGETQLTASNRELAYKTKPGLLADLVGCVAAIGPGASVAAAHPDGVVDRYRKAIPELPEEMTQFGEGCPVVLVDPQAPVYGEGAERAASAAAADAAVADLLSVLPPDAVVMVAGISDASMPVNLHPLMLRADGYADRWLTSAATRRDGYVQLADIGPTIVTLTGGEVAGSGMTGQPMRPTESRPGGVSDTVTWGITTNLAGQQIPPLSDGFYSTLTILGLLVIAAAIVLCRRGTRSRRGGRLAAVLLPITLAVASLPVASLLVNALPWWRAERPAITLWAVMVGICLVLAAVAWLGPWRRHPLGPPTVIAAVTAVVIGVDCATGASLQFNSLTGYSAITGARFTGMGNYAFGVFAAGAVMAALYASWRLRGAWRVAVIAAVGVAAVLVDGLPGFGNDVGGVIALTPAFILAGLHAMGRRLSVKKILASLLIGGLTISAIMVMDYLRPPEQRTHLGRFVGEVLNGAAVDTLMRKASAALGTITAGPLTLLVIGACVALPLIWRTGVVEQVVARYPVVLSVGIGVATVSVLGFAFNDSGIAVPAFTLAVAAPLLVATAARHVTSDGVVQRNSSRSR
ncbi:phosphoglycerate mutase [Stackebrandtia albiflava]|uniref:Phosphoglycerate mutase n=1 Tax=Stackebrandtia albiflava TaxID=406432 RepID=A0A562VDH6_9ACTN|nr:phosphoglycerate mutase [Stackebrandtia albiflava]